MTSPRPRDPDPEADDEEPEAWWGPTSSDVDEADLDFGFSIESC